MAKKQKTAIDPSQTVEISASALQLLGSFALTVLAGLGIGAAVWLNAEILTTVALVAFLIGTAVLVGVSFYLAKLMLRSDAPVVTISPEGVCDRRLSADTVSWRDIDHIRPRRNRQAQVIELVLSKEADKALTYKPLPRLLRSYHRLSNSVRFAVSAHGLKISHKQLQETLEAYIKAHGPQPE
ncbi:MAG: hypothetical protein GY948_08920 [Alphaproteobacteria bacterium]|nr:hypothetical protein [Alphaproteobacteria bacterium]